MFARSVQARPALRAEPPRHDHQALWRWLTLLGVGVVLIARKPDALLHAQFWAEDGSIFFRDAHNAGLRSVFFPYSGYYHVVPRLIAFCAGKWPLLAQPTLYAWSAWGVTMAVAAKLLSPRVRLPGKPALALALALIPRGNGEILLTLAGLQWFLAVGLTLCLVQEEAQTPGQAWGDLAWLVLAGLSGPFALLYLPLFWLRWKVAFRTEWSFVCAGVISVCAMAQLRAVLAFRAGEAHWPDVGQWLEVFVRRPIGSLLLGARQGDRIMATGPAVGLAAALLALVIHLAWRQRGQRWAITALLGAAGLTLVATVFRFLHAAGLLFARYEDGERYFFVPKLYLTWCLVICCETERSRWGRGIALGALLLIGWGAVVDFRCAPYEEMHWGQQARRLERGETRVIPINPHWEIDLDAPSEPGAAPLPSMNSYDPAMGDGILLSRAAAIRSALPPLRVTIHTQGFLQVHPPGEVVFDIPPGSREMSAEFTIRPEALRPSLGTPGTEFRADYSPANGAPTTTLWQRTLEPLAASEDRAVQTMRVALPADAAGQITLRTLPASKANDTTNAWACWARVRFELATHQTP